MSVGGVIRYVPTHIDKDGARTLMRAAQGGQTFATTEEAQAWIDAVRRNNSTDTLRSVFGPDTYEVRECECWPMHFDPKGVYF